MSGPAAAPAKAGAARWAPNAFQVVLLAFSTFVAVGTALLSLPAAHAGPAHRFVDDLFMAASAVCVTGLAVIDPATSYSPFGQGILLLLIQMGGLGYMTLFTLGILLVGRRMSMRDRLALQLTAEQTGMGGVVKHVRRILAFTLLAEASGFLVLAALLVPAHGAGYGAWLAFFHAISAFNNSGLSLLPQGAVAFQHQPGVLVTLAALTIVASLGFNVVHEIRCRAMRRREEVGPAWSPLAVIVLALTAAFLVGGTALFWVFEHANPRTLGPLGPGDQLANAFFMAVQPRSSGFNSVDTAALEGPTVMMFLIMMFIGGGPGGIAGGIKLTTFAIMLAAVWATLRGQADVTLPGLRRRVNEALVRKAFAVFFASVSYIVLMAALVDAIEPHAFLPVLFEVTSAFGTNGLSIGITGHLGEPAKLLLVATMLIGRVGILSVMLSIFTARRPSAVRYGEEPLMIG
jgi:trk system potassium uptake protein TrkH